jgi:hypothetical protein
VVPNTKKSGGLRLNQKKQLCLYLDEIIDVRILEDDDPNKQPTKALLCSNNELLKVVDLETGSVLQ